MNIAQYGAAAVAGLKSIVDAARQFRDNSLTSQVNRVLWGRWWVAALTLLTGAGIFAEVILPSFETVVGLAPMLTGLAVTPRVVRDLFISVPALFGLVVAWRVHRLRSSDRESWPDRASVEDFGGSLFDAGALPVAIATVVLAVCGYIGDFVVASPGGLLLAGTGLEASEGFGISGAIGRLASTVLTVALVAGILSVHRALGKGIGQLIGAGFFVWCAHITIGFTLPWMVSWTSFVPVIGRFFATRSPELALALFDLAVGCAAWMAAREKCRSAPFWVDASPSPPPPPPPPPPVPGDSKGDTI
ncbi:MAG: hypothetical protein QNL88_15095 [Acidobacteriota bacterium]|nr:hypothetical protein [Acidobacteriota bacterium]